MMLKINIHKINHFIIGMFMFTSLVFAEEVLLKSAIVEPLFEAEITVEDFVPVGKAILFDAAESHILNEEEFGKAEFTWDFHDGKSLEKDKEQIYVFDTTGKKKITLTIKQGKEITLKDKEIFVYQKKTLLITNKSKGGELREIEEQAAEDGTWMKIIQLDLEDKSFLTEEKLFKKLTEFSDFIKESDFIVFYTESTESLSILSKYLQSLIPDEKLLLKNKSLIQISEGNFTILNSIVNQLRKILGVEKILLTRPEALIPIFGAEDYSQIKTTLENRAIEYVFVDDSFERSNIFIFSKMVSFFISSGIPINTIYLLLVFPFVAFFVTFAKQFIGISTYGTYLPMMVSLSFFILGATFSFVVLTVVGVLSILIRIILNKFEMLYVPKVALTLSTITLSFFVVIWFALEMEASVIIPLSIFPMLIMSTLSERFISAKSQEGSKSAMIGMLETIIVAFFAYLFSSWSYFHDIILSFPEVILLPLVGIIILGRFTGLRISEYIKFSPLLREGVEE